MNLILKLACWALANIFIAHTNAVDMDSPFRPARVVFYPKGGLPSELTVSSAKQATTVDASPTVVITHGYYPDESGAYGNSKWIKELTSQLNQLEKPPNVIVYDYYSYLRDEFLSFGPQTVANAGGHLGDVLQSLIKEKKIKNEAATPITLVGYHLGAHVAAHAGKRIIQLGGTKVARITGLDPSIGPYSPTLTPASQRLSEGDATLVDVIHTNGPPIFGYGWPLQMGHVDFWPNGGQLQPGCGLDGGCSSKRAHAYYVESVATKDFLAFQCTDWNSYNSEACVSNEATDVIMGYNYDMTKTDRKANYYLKTDSKSPYALGGGKPAGR